MKINVALCCLIVILTQSGCDQQATPTNELNNIGSVAPQSLVVPEEVNTSNERNVGDPLPKISPSPVSKTYPSYEEIEWDALVPAEYHPNAILAKYKDQLDKLNDDDSQAMEIYGEIMAELDNAPINESLAGKKVKLAGFIAPLENKEGSISEFLLVPYFGACIHVPPPPVNQTVLVKTTKASMVEADKVNDPVWVIGEITTKAASTGIGDAGYVIVNAITQPYE